MAQVNSARSELKLKPGWNDSPGRQLVIVQYSPDHNPFDEWVYNAADIDGSKVIWARGMDTANDLELIRIATTSDRKVWLVQPDKEPAEVSPYLMSEPEGARLTLSKVPKFKV